MKLCHRLVCLLLMAPLGHAELRFESFDTDPAWDGHNNFSTAFEMRPVVQDFGYAPTTHCNAIPGEIGGTITPDATPAYCAKALAPLSFNAAFAASGTLTVAPGGGHTLIGFFNTDSINEWRTPNSAVFRIYGRGGVFQVYFEYGTSLWRAGGASMSPLEFPAGTYAWSLAYTPIGAQDGQLTLTFGGYSAVCNFDAGHRADGASLTHFGLLALPKHPDDSGQLWIDDIVINGAPENFATDPAWEAAGNHASYLSEDTRPRFAFGYSATQFAGGALPGEIGGKFYRGDCRYPETLAYYGAPIAALSLDNPLQAAGKVCFRRGVSDSTTLFGFFHSEHSIEVNPSQSSSLPKEFLGFAIEGPSAEGFYIYPCYRTTVDGGGRNSGPGLPRIYPDSQTREWNFSYEPQANGGDGEIRLSCGGTTATLPLPPGHRAMGAQFNRFGFITPWIDGNGQTVYFDEIQYTHDIPTRARFTATPASGSLPLQVSFTDQSESRSPITQWAWDFGDGSPRSLEQHPGHTYTEPGAYTVTLAITTADDSDATTQSWHIAAGTTLPALAPPGLLLLAGLLLLCGAAPRMNAGGGGQSLPPCEDESEACWIINPLF